MSAPRIALVSLALAAGCASAGADPVAPDPRSDPAEEARTALERYVPAGAEAIVTVDYARLRERGFARLFADVDEDARLKLREQRGFSDGEDVDRAVTATFPAGTGAPVALEAYEGRFSRAAVEAAFARRHGTPEATRWRDRPLVAARDGERALSLPEERVLVLAPVAELRAALDCRARIGRCVADEAWDDEVRAALGARWSARVPTVLEVRARVGDDMKERLARELGDGDRLRWFGLRVGAARGLEALLVARARDEREARDFAARLRGHLGDLARRPLVAALGAGPAFDDVRVAVREDVVEARLVLGDADWARLERRLEEVAAAVRRARETDGGSAVDAPRAGDR